MSERKISQSPPKLVEAGQCLMGTFNTAVVNPNVLDVDRPMGFKLPVWVNNLRLKEWEAAQISNEDWFICVAVYNTKLLGTAVIMAYHKKEKRQYLYQCKPFAWQLKLPKNLYDSHCYYHGESLSIDFFNNLEKNRIEVKFQAQATPHLPAIEASFVATHTTEPIVICHPFAKNRPLYSHKALMPVEGQLICGDITSTFQPTNACMIIDDHKGYYPYVMQYDWVTALGFAGDGRLTGFNLTNNQILEPEIYNENCLWINGKMSLLPAITIERPDGVAGQWIIRERTATNRYGERISLLFTPIVDMPVKINLGVVKVDYHGPTGRFSGHIVDNAGHKISFNQFIGMGEKKYIRL